MSNFSNWLTDAKSAAGIGVVLVTLIVFIYNAHANSEVALEENDKQDARIAKQNNKIDRLAQGQSEIKTEVALTKQAAERTEKDVSDMKSDISYIRSLLMKDK